MWACIGWHTFGILFVPDSYGNTGIKVEFVTTKLCILKNKFPAMTKVVEMIIQEIRKNPTKYNMFPNGEMPFDQQAVDNYAEFIVKILLNKTMINTTICMDMISSWLSLDGSERVRQIRSIHMKALKKVIGKNKVAPKSNEKMVRGHILRICAWVL